MTHVTCCGWRLECPRFTNTCPRCGADYNASGQRLAPREQWGEEDGSTAAEILSYDSLSIDQLLGDD